MEERLNVVSQADLFNHMSNGISIYRKIPNEDNFLILDMNESGARINKVLREEVIGKSIVNIFPECTENGLLNTLLRVWSTGAPEDCPVVFKMDNKIKSYRNNHIYKLPSLEIVSVFEDVTAQKQNEEALRKSEARYSLAIEGIKDGIWHWDMDDDIVFHSKRWKEIYEIESDVDLRFGLWKEFVHPDDFSKVGTAIEDFLSGKNLFLELEHRIKTKSGVKWILNRGKSVLNDKNQVIAMAGAITDITERKILEQKMLYMANHDSLTDVKNRGYFDRLANEVKDKLGVGIIIVDIDGLKLINDSLGHHIGDNVIKATAKILKESLCNEKVCRIGGDEFGVICVDTTESHLEALIRRIRIYEKEYLQKNLHLPIGLSIGYAVKKNTNETYTDLFSRADKMSYKNKEERLGLTRIKIGELKKEDL